MASEPRFAGFTPAALRLLAALDRHNDRAWFAPRKERFTRELLEPMRALVLDATDAFATLKIPLMGDPQRSVFRIYRDLRFTPDKRPYRPYLAAYLSADGGRATPGGAYVRVAPRDSFLGVAFYQLPPPMLQRWRATMAARPRAFSSVISKLAKRGLAIELPDDSDDALVRVPRAFAALEGSELAPYFRLRSFVVRRALDANDIGSAALTQRIIETVRDAKPLLGYGWPLV